MLLTLSAGSFLLGLGLAIRGLRSNSQFLTLFGGMLMGLGAKTLLF